MKLVEMNWNPTDRQLRQFGVIALVALPILGWMWRLPTGGIVGFGVAGLLAGTAAGICPRALKYPFVGLTLATLPIGLVVGEVAMLLVYLGIFTPVALGFRLCGRDALQRRFEPAASTYWQPKARAADPAAYLRQS